MQNLFNALEHINPFSIITNNQVANEANNTDVTNTIRISKNIFDRSFHNPSFQLPLVKDIWKEIFSGLSFNELNNCASLSIKCYKLVNEPNLSKKAIYHDFCFNPSHWNHFFGEGTVQKNEIDKAFNLLPKDINEILKSPCPAFPNKRIMDTHMAVWIPESINGKPLTIDSFGLLLKQQPEFSENETGYQYLWNNIVQQMGSNSIKSGWVLMTTDVIPESRRKSFAEQQELVKKLNKDGHPAYRVPNAGEAIISIYAKYLMSGTKKRLFSDESYTYTRCQE